MIEIFAQPDENYRLIPASREYLLELRSYKPRQMLRLKIWGTRKERSVQQNKWLHAMFRVVASTADDDEWDTPEKVKRKVKMAMHFFKEEVTVMGNKVYFELRSFSFDKMEHNEANVRYEDAKNICAKKLGIDPEVLEAEAKNEDKTHEQRVAEVMQAKSSVKS